MLGLRVDVPSDSDPVDNAQNYRADSKYTGSQVGGHVGVGVGVGVGAILLRNFDKCRPMPRHMFHFQTLRASDSLAPEPRRMLI